jgi:hypothetical protein
MKVSYLLAGLVVLLSFTNSAAAQHICSSLFLKAGIKTDSKISKILKESQSFSEVNAGRSIEVLVKNLKANGFAIANGNLIDKTNNDAFLGQFEVRTAPQLYEWAQPDFQEIWMKNGGLSQKDVDENVRGSSQSYGRGYYVSTNPFDSSEYGNGFSIFQSAGPIYTIKNAASCWGDLKIIKRLKNSGIDGFSDGRTWLALISSRHLEKVHEINDPIWSSAEQLPQILLALPQIANSKMNDVFSSRTLTGRIIHNKLTKEDISLLRLNLVHLDLPENLLVQYPALRQVQVYTSEFYIAMGQSRDKEELGAFLEMMPASKVNNFIAANKDKLNSNIFEMMKYVDIQNLYGSLTKRNTEFDSLDTLFHEVKKTVKNHSRVNFRVASIFLCPQV